MLFRLSLLPGKHSHWVSVDSQASEESLPNSGNAGTVTEASHGMSSEMSEHPIAAIVLMEA